MCERQRWMLGIYTPLFCCGLQFITFLLHSALQKVLLLRSLDRTAVVLRLRVYLVPQLKNFYIRAAIGILLFSCEHHHSVNCWMVLLSFLSSVLYVVCSQITP